MGVDHRERDPGQVAQKDVHMKTLNNTYATKRLIIEAVTYLFLVMYDSLPEQVILKRDQVERFWNGIKEIPFDDIAGVDIDLINKQITIDYCSPRKSYCIGLHSVVVKDGYYKAWIYISDGYKMYLYGFYDDFGTPDAE